MGLIITSKLQALRHGAYVIEQAPPAVIQPEGAEIAAMVEQFPWGPDQVIYTPSSAGDRINTFCPPGMDRTSEGYLSMSQKAFPLLKIVRVTGSGAAAATGTVTKTGPTNMLTLTLKYKGVAGNSVTWQTTAATDGDANHFNLTVSVVGPSGTTVDTLQNLNYSGTGADSVPTFTNLNLLGGITKLASGIPVLTSGTFSGGSDGTVTSADYVGTQGSANKGLALLEADKDIRHVFFGDPGNSLRAACNAGMLAHVDYMGDRCGWINGDSGQTFAAVQTDVANYRSINMFYVDDWAYINDDVDGTKRLVPPAPFAASMATNLSPSTSVAWKSQEATKYLNAIVGLETDRGEAAALNTQNGVVTLQREALGGYSFEAGVNTEAPIDPARKSDCRTRMLHYIGTALVGSVRPFVDSPNVNDNQQNIVEAVERFMDTLKRNASRDPNHLPHILDYIVNDLSLANDNTSLAAGEFAVPLSVKISASMAKIFFLLQIGETVTINTNV